MIFAIWSFLLYHSIDLREGFSGAGSLLHNGHLGSAQMGTNAAGNGHCRGLLRLYLIHCIKYFGLAKPAAKWREKYTPYGSSMNNPAANDNQAGFTGHIKDSATGLNYMQARYYDPLIGRFLSIDPVGFSPDALFMFNRYTYVNNDPVNLTDPFGMQPDDENNRNAATTAASVATAIVANEGMGAQSARTNYNSTVSNLDSNDSAGRSAAKTAAIPLVTAGSGVVGGIVGGFAGEGAVNSMFESSGPPCSSCGAHNREGPGGPHQ
jgi:RHS repeat-associated protein